LKKNAKRYNCSIIDLYDKSVLATLNSKRIDAELAIQTLQIALDRNPVKGKIILHSDQGSQYTSRAFTEFCEGKGIRQSMNKAGCPYDNSPMESFYGEYPKVCVNLRTGVRYNYSVWRFLLWQEEKVTHHRKQQCAK
jgi:putative transposase